MSEEFQGKTLKNAAIGVVVTTVAYFIPVVNAIAPIFGGGVAGYLQKQGIGGGMKAGAAKGLLTVLPAVPIAVIGGAVLADVPVIGGFLAGGTLIIALLIVVHSTIVGVVGGFFGGLLSGTGSSAQNGN